MNEWVIWGIIVIVGFGGIGLLRLLLQNKKNISNNQETPKIDAGEIAKSYAVGATSHWIANIIIGIPIIIFWGICYYLLFITGWAIKIAPNVRGVLIIAIAAIPLIAAAIFHKKIKEYFSQRFSK